MLFYYTNGDYVSWTSVYGWEVNVCSIDDVKMAYSHVHNHHCNIGETWRYNAKQRHKSYDNVQQKKKRNLKQRLYAIEFTNRKKSMWHTP